LVYYDHYRDSHYYGYIFDIKTRAMT
jgi:hypothetical protein